MRSTVGTWYTYTGTISSSIALKSSVSSLTLWIRSISISFSQSYRFGNISSRNAVQVNTNFSPKQFNHDGEHTFSPLGPGVPPAPRSPGMPAAPWCPGAPAAPAAPGSPWRVHILSVIQILKIICLDGVWWHIYLLCFHQGQEYQQGHEHQWVPEHQKYQRVQGHHALPKQWWKGGRTVIFSPECENKHRTSNQR